MPSRSIRYAKTVDGFHVAYDVVGASSYWESLQPNATHTQSHSTTTATCQSDL